MAANAFILVNTDPANTGEVIQRLGAIAGARAREVLSPDFVVDLEADIQEDITVILPHKIHPIKGITNTVTCICFSFQRPVTSAYRSSEAPRASTSTRYPFHPSLGGTDHRPNRRGRVSVAQPWWVC